MQNSYISFYTIFVNIWYQLFLQNKEYASPKDFELSLVALKVWMKNVFQKSLSKLKFDISLHKLIFCKKKFDNLSLVKTFCRAELKMRYI